MMFLQRYPGLPDRKVKHEEYLEPVELVLDDVHILDLSQTYERIVSSIDFSCLSSIITNQHNVERPAVLRGF